MNLYEMFDKPTPTLIDALRDFLPIAIKHLKLDHIPKIRLVKEIADSSQPAFGRFVNDDKVIYVVVDKRNPVDILRTLAHELVHYQQGEEHRLDQDSGNTGSPIEDEANAEGGVIMRLFNQAHPVYMKSDPIQVTESRGEPQPLPRWNTFENYYRPWPKGTWQDIMFYMHFAQGSYLTSGNPMTGSDVANVMASLYNTNPANELSAFNDKHNSRFTSWDDVYDKMRQVHHNDFVDAMTQR